VTSQPPLYDCAIVGAGPAGLFAAIQCVRLGLSYTLFEQHRMGGQVWAANLIENAPGFPEGIRGPELVAKFEDHAKSYSIQITGTSVQNISHSCNHFTLHSSKGEHRARTVIAATGLIPKHLGISGEDTLRGKHVYYYINPSEVTCTGSRVTIIGSGDAAFDQALNFARTSKHVTIIMKHDKPRCLPVLVQRAHRIGIDTVSSFEATGLEKTADGVRIYGSHDMHIDTDIVIVCIGKNSSTYFLDSISTDDTPGLFLAGDCHREKNRHIAIACGDGIACAMEASRFIAHEDNT